MVRYQILMPDERSLSDVVSTILIIFMVLMLAIVIMVLVFGTTIFQQKSAFVVMNITNETHSGKNTFVIFDRGGDEVYLNSSQKGMHLMSINIDNRTSSWKAQPVAGLNVVKPGTTLYVYYNSANRVYRVTTDAATLTTSEAAPVTDCPLHIRLVDEDAHLLIASWNWSCIPLPPTGPAPTVASMTNTTGYRGWPVIENITGTNFLSGATVKFNRTGYADIPAASCSYVSSTRLLCTFDLLEKSAATYNVVVTNPDGKQGMRANYFVLSSPAPTYTGSTNTTGSQATTVTVISLRGTYFQPTTTFAYWQGTSTIPMTTVTVINATIATGTIVIPSDAPVGSYNLTIYNTDYRNVTRTGAFTVSSNAPTVTGLSNRTGYRGWTVLETITGTNFVTGSTAQFNGTGLATIPASSCTRVSATSLSCIFDLLGKDASATNGYNIVVTNPDGKQGMRASYFTLSSPSPTISSSTPSSGVRGTTVSITNLAGNYFQPGATITYWRGTTVYMLGSVAVPARTQITGSLPLDASAPLGAYNITVTNTDGKSVTRASGFTVYGVPPPTISGISPGTGPRGIAVPVVVTGSSIVTGARVRVYNGTTSVYLVPLGTVTSTQISTTFTIPVSVLPGTMNIRITNPDGQYATLTGGYVLT